MPMKNLENVSDKQLKDSYELESAINKNKQDLKSKGFDIDSGFKKEAPKEDIIKSKEAELTKMRDSGKENTTAYKQKENELENVAYFRDLNEQIGGRGFDTPKGYLGIEIQDDGKLVAGSVTNTGLMKEYQIDYDTDKSLDDNLSDLYDLVFGEDYQPESEEKNTQKFVYQFPKLTKNDIEKAKEYGLNVEATMLKDDDYNTKGDMILSGDEENLRNFANEVLDYELNPDYTYKYQDYDFDDLEQQGYLSRGESETDSDRVYSKYDENISVARSVYDSFAESKGGWEKTEDEMINYLFDNKLDENEVQDLYDYLTEYNLHNTASYLAGNASNIRDIIDYAKNNKFYTLDKAMKDYKEGKDTDTILDSVYEDKEPDFDETEDYYARFDEVVEEKIQSGEARPYSSMIMDLEEEGYINPDEIKEDIWAGLSVDEREDIARIYELLDEDNEYDDDRDYEVVDYLQLDDLLGYKEDDWYYDILNNRDLRYDYPL